MMIDLSGRPFHFIGIGGIGMSGLAHILAKRQLPVSGSDLRATHITEGLQDVGVHIFTSQDPANFDIYKYNSNLESNNQLPQVICSTAINNTNAEYLAALELGCPIFHRSDLLAALIKDYESIAVSGTHGKTTTSSSIGYMLLQAGMDPTIIVGGEVDAWEGNARLGYGKYLVAEADESDGSLLKHSPKIGIITNIELDHPDRFESLEELINIFQVFSSQCELIIGCIDCETVAQKLKPNITYSMDPEKNADYTVTDISYNPEGSSAVVWEKGKKLGIINLKLLGKHNLSNTLAVIASGRLLNLEFEQIASAMATFQGAKRRFEERGKYNNITLIDDYAHHPSEIKATLSAARQRVSKYDAKRIVAIFQPHRYSRTQTFMKEFGECWQDADLVVITDIYSAGEPKIDNLSGKDVADEISNHHHHVIYHPSLQSNETFLKELLTPGDMALFLGAGNLNQVIDKLIPRKSNG